MPTPGIQLPDGIDVLNPIPADKKYGPYASLAAAKAAIPQSLRYDGMTVQITGLGNYWWLQTDLTDSGLIPKNSGSGGSSLPIAKYVYLVEDPSDATLMGGAASNVYTTAQAAYDAAQILSGPTFIPVVIIIGKTTVAGVGDIVITDNYGWNTSVSLKGLGAANSFIGNIILDNATGNVPGMGNFWANDLSINSISALATGVTGNGPSAMAMELSGVSIPGGILMGTNNAANTTASGGNLSISNFDSYSANNIGDIIITPGSAATWGSIDISTKGTIGNIDISTGISGGNVNLGGALQMAALTLTQSSGTGTVVTVSDDVYINSVDINVNGNNTLNFRKCTIGGLSANTTTGVLNTNMNGTILLTPTATTNAPIVATKCSFTDISSLSNNSRLYDCTINGRIISIGTGCSIINCEILSIPQPSISNPTAVTVIGDGTYWRTAPQSTVTVTNAVSVIPTTRYVYLVQDTADLNKMGTRHNNVYTTFQAAYDAANALQVALGGTNIVVIQVGNITAAAAGNLTLTTNFNQNVAINGINLSVSNLGNIIATNAAGNGFNVGGALSTTYIKISNVSLTNILTNATGAAGSSGSVGITGSNIKVNNIDTSITNAANITGNGGAVRYNVNTNNFANINSIITTSKSTTSSAGLISISAPSLSITSIITANDNLGGGVSIGSANGRIFIASFTCSSRTANSTALIRFTNCSFNQVAISMYQNSVATFENCTLGNSGTVVDSGDTLGCKVNLNNCIVNGTYTSGASFKVQTVAVLTNFLNISNLGDSSQLINCALNGGALAATISQVGINTKIYNTTVMGGTLAIDNSIPVTVKGTNSIFDNGVGANVTII